MHGRYDTRRKSTALEGRSGHRLGVLRCCAALCAVMLAGNALRASAQTTPEHDFSSMDRVMATALKQRLVPGAVIVVGHNGHVVFEKAYGERSLEPEKLPMTEDTVFDMASLTKPLATTTAVMQLYQQGYFRLNDPVSKYLPEFASHGKQSITIRQLMTHYSGLPEDVDLSRPWSGKQEGLQLAYDVTPLTPPGIAFRYSDINFIVLGALVEKLSGMTLDEYTAQKVFAPLGMEHTRFLPPTGWLPRVAPTQYDEHHQMLHGVVHDPTARRMGGVAGHAGLFSTAGDVAIFAQNLLDLLHGRPSKFPLDRLTAQKMTTPQQPATGTSLRGLGWDIESPFSSNRGELFPVGSFGHTGFTGTSLWIDPWSDSYVVFLSNRVHPNGGTSTVALYGLVANAAAQSLRLSIPEAGSTIAHLTGYNESLTGMRRFVARNGSVQTGIDVLEAERFAPLAALAKQHGGRLRLGLLTNQTGTDSAGRRTIDVLAKDAPTLVPGLRLQTIFSPEHGIQGALDTTHVPSGTDSATGLPVLSLYGATDAKRRPPLPVLRKLDAVVIDLQDAGVRFYTYETLVGYFLQAAAQTGTEIIVLDRPDPLGGSFVQGPVSDAGASTYTNFMPLPVRHGMTLGELARYFNGEDGIHAPLTVVPMQGWQRGDWYDSTALLWTDPSPNLRNLEEAVLYPGIGMLETANISVGRGTDTPFAWIGAPWIQATDLAAALNKRLVPGVRFVPVEFTPQGDYPYAHQRCQGVGFVILDRNVLDAPELGMEVASMLHKLYPTQFKLDAISALVRNRATLDALDKGVDPQSIAGLWRESVRQFEERRAPYLLYGEKRGD